MAGDGSPRVLTTVTAGQAAKGQPEGVDDEYLRSVLQEVLRREQRLAKLEEERRLLDFELAKLSADRVAKRGDAGSMRVLESFRKSLQVKALALEQGRAEARKDLERALERKREVEAEMERQNRKG